MSNAPSAADVTIATVAALSTEQRTLTKSTDIVSNLVVACSRKCINATMAETMARTQRGGKLVADSEQECMQRCTQRFMETKMFVMQRSANSNSS